MRSKAKASSSCISPSRLARERARDAIGGDRFVEVCVKAAAESCATRDPKGLYQRAHSGDLPAFAGVSAPYQAPTTPPLILDTELLAFQLVRRCPDPCRIQLIERRPRFGHGLAHSAGNLNHVLNVPTSKMSALHDWPDDFLDWLREKSVAGAVSVAPSCFVARKVF